MRAVVVVLLALAGVGRAADGDWVPLGARDGIAIERRSTGDPPLRELRLTAHSPAPPATVMATLWRHEEYPQFLPFLKRLDVLRDEGDTKLVYEQLSVPLVKDRDLTVRVTRTVSPDTGTYEVTSVLAPDEGPPESDEFVRVRTSQGHWRLAPAPDGGTAVTYTIRGDAGGRMPGWIFDTVQKEAALKILRAMLDRVARARGAD